MPLLHFNQYNSLSLDVDFCVFCYGGGSAGFVVENGQLVHHHHSVWRQLYRSTWHKRVVVVIVV